MKFSEIARRRRYWTFYEAVTPVVRTILKHPFPRINKIVKFRNAITIDGLVKSQPDGFVNVQDQGLPDYSDALLLSAHPAPVKNREGAHMELFTKPSKFCPKPRPLVAEHSHNPLVIRKKRVIQPELHMGALFAY